MAVDEFARISNDGGQTDVQYISLDFSIAESHTNGCYINLGFMALF